MRGRWRHALSAALLACALDAAARPDAADEPAAYPPVQQEELYRDALRELDAGRPELAAPMLLRFLASEPLHAGAWLDLALAQCKLGHSEEAEQLFQDIERRFNPPATIREVIQQYRNGGCLQTVVPTSAWQVSLGRGHDSNVNQGMNATSFRFTPDGPDYELDPSFRPHPDAYTLVSGSLVQPLHGTASGSNTLAILQFYGREFDTIREQNTVSLLAGLEQSWRAGDWRHRATVMLGATTLARDMYQRQQQLQFRTTPPFKLPALYDLAFTAGVSHVGYATRPSYDSNNAELGLALAYRHKSSNLLLNLSAMADHGRSARPGGDRHGLFASTQWYTALRSNLYADLSLSHQYWRSEQAYSPGVIEQRRRQNATTLRGALQWYWRPNYSVQLELRSTWNRENIALFQYNSRAAQLSVRWDNF